MPHPPSPDALHEPSRALRAGIDAALARPVLLDPRALAGVHAASAFVLRTRRPGAALAHGAAGYADGADAADAPPYTRVGDVAVVDVRGPLAQRAWSCMGMFGGDGYDAIAERCAAALADPDCAALLLRIDSPGGECAGCFEAVRAIRASADAAGRPVVAYADEMAASAGYALACAADAIVLPETGLLGSVGVITVVGDRVKANEAEGLNLRVVRSGPLKAVPHPDEPLTDAGVALVQLEVDSLARVFAGVVASRRGMNTADVLAMNAGVFYGAAAVRAGLADRVAPFSGALALAQQMAARRRAEPVQPTQPAPPPAQRAATTPTPRGSMSEHHSKALGLAPDASDPEQVDAIRALVGFRTEVLAIAKADAPDAALAVLKAHAIAAAKLPAIEALAAATQTRLDAEERAAMLAEGKRDGKLTPAHFDASTKPGAKIAAKSNAELRDYLDTATPDPRLAGAPPPKEPPPAAAALLDAQAFAAMPGEAKARLLRDDPTTYAALEAAAAGQ